MIVRNFIKLCARASLLLTLFCVGTMPAYAQIVTNGDFETGGAGAIGFEPAAPWNAAGTNLILIQATGIGGSNGAQFNASRSLDQNLTGTVAGLTYRITVFASHIGASAGSSISGDVNGALFFSQVGGAAGFNLYSSTFIANGADNINFGAAAVPGPGGEWVLDNISVVQEVPELNASTAGIPVAIAFCLFAVIFSRRKSSQVVTA